MSDAKDQLAENDLRKQLEEEEGERWNLARRLEIATLEVERLKAENAQLRKELERQRQGLQTILELRKIAGTDRYGALTRDEIEEVIMDIDAVLRAAIDIARKGEEG